MLIFIIISHNLNIYFHVQTNDLTSVKGQYPFFNNEKKTIDSIETGRRYSRLSFGPETKYLDHFV
jgi:hypothetical protein